MRPTGLRKRGRRASSTWAILTATSCGSRPLRGDVRVAGAEHVLRPRPVGAVLRANARRALPDVGDVRSRLDQNHLDAELIDIEGERLRPALDRPLRGDIDRIAGLAGERRLARHDDDASRCAACGRSAAARASAPCTPKKFVSMTRRSSALGDVLEGAAGGDAGVVHHRVEEAAGDGERLGDALWRSMLRPSRRAARCRRSARRTRLCQRRVERALALEVAHRGDDAPAALCQLDGRQQTKARRRSRDQNRAHPRPKPKSAPFGAGQSGGSVVRSDICDCISAVKRHWRTNERAAPDRAPLQSLEARQPLAQYTRALGSMYLTSLVIVCVCTGR